MNDPTDNNPVPAFLSALCRLHRLREMISPPAFEPVSVFSRHEEFRRFDAKRINNWLA
jgi:hypothetical protein